MRMKANKRKKNRLVTASARPTRIRKLHNVKASKCTGRRKIMAGAGSGITLVLKDFSISQVANNEFYGDFNSYHDFLEPKNGNCKGTIEIESIGTYYNGGNPGLGDIPVNIVVEGVYPDDEEAAKEVFDAGLREVLYESELDDKKVRIGGGWSRSSFDGTFKVDLYASSFDSVVSLEITIPNKELVRWLDEFANGENEVIEYVVCINDDPQGDYYESQEDAIATAEKYAEDPAYADDEITVMMNHYNLDYNGDIQDYFSDDSDIVWSSNDSLYE